MLDLGMQILKWLAVAGGGAVGWLGSGLLLRLLVRLSLQRTVPRKALMPVRALGALALGLAVWMWAFSSGESGPGWGGWLGSRGSGGRPPQAKTEPDTELTAERETAPPKRSAPESQPELGQETLRIEILGGARVQQERFYLLEGDNEPRTLSEVRKALQARRQGQDKPPLRGIVIMVYGSSVATEHPAVRNLANWAKENGLSVTFPPIRGVAP